MSGVINPNLIQRCARLAQAYRDIRAHAPLRGFLNDRPGSEKLFERQERLDRLAALDRFRIGFVGPSQVGKSFTVANLLDVSQEDAPTPTGGGGPRTSAVTRVHAAQPGRGHEITLRYLTRDEYDVRRRALCDELDLDAQQSDGELIARVQPNPNVKNPGEEETRLSLLRLLEARRAHGHAIDSGEEQGDYASRSDYLCHPIDGDAQAHAKLRYALLRQATVAFDTQRLHKDLEVIDLPGLDVANAADRLLTLSFLPELNGVFIFQSTRQVRSGSAGELLKLLYKEHRGGLGRRVWAVFTLFDALNPSLYNGIVDGQTIFDHIQGFLGNNGIPLDQALLVGNQIHQNLLDRKRAAPEQFPGETLPPPIAGDYANGVMVPLDADGEPVIPPKFQDDSHAALLKAYKEVLRDGGIGRLRQVILGDVVNAVRAEVENQIENELRDLSNSMRELLDDAVQVQDLSTSDVIKAALWGKSLGSAVLPPIQRDGVTATPLAETLRADLTTLLHQLDTGPTPANQFAMTHQSNTNALKSQGLQTARAQSKVFFNAIDDFCTFRDFVRKRVGR